LHCKDALEVIPPGHFLCVRGLFCVPLNIKNPEVERLIEEISQLTGETKTDLQIA